MNRARQDLVKTRQAAQQASAGFAELGNSLKNAAAGVASFAALKAGITSIVQETVKLDQLTSAFKAIGGSAQDAQKMLAFVRGEANRLGVNANSLADGFKQISAAAKGTALEGQGVRNIFTAVSEASRVLGLSAEQTQGALNAIGQSISKGAIQAEELRGQLGERLPGAMQVMARALGVSTEQLSEMLDKGELKGQAMVDAWAKFGAQLRTEFGGAVTEATGKADASFARLDNALSQTASTIGKDLVPALGQVAEAFATLLLSQQETAAGLGAALAPVLRQTGAAAISLSSGVILAGKGIAALGVLASGDLGAWNIALKDMAETAARTDKIIEDLLNPKTPTAAGAAAGSPGGIALDISKVSEVADKAHDRFADWLSPLDLAKKKLTEIEAQLEKLSKTGPVSAGTGRAPAGLQARIHAAAIKAGVDPYTFESLIKQESGYNPKAVGPMTKYGTAKGLGQLVDSTATSLGVTDPFDVDQNLAGSARYLAQQTRAFGSVPLGLAAYNAGPGNVRKHGGIPPFQETQAYVPAIMDRADAFRRGSTDSTADATTYNRLLTERQGLLTAIAVMEGDTAADTAVADANDAKARSVLRLIESLNNGTKALSEIEEAELRTLAATLDADSGARRRLDTLLDEAEAVRLAREDWERYQVALDDAATSLREHVRISKELAAEQLQQERDNMRTSREEYLQSVEDVRTKHQELGADALDFGAGLVDALQRGGDAWEEFGNRVIDTMLRIAIEKSGLEEQLGEWIAKGLNLLSGLSGGTSLNTDALMAGNAGDMGSVDMSGFLGGMAAGGPVSAGRPYLVGEQGLELVIPQSAGTVISNSAIRNAYANAAHHATSHTVSGMGTVMIPGQARARGGPVSGGRAYLVGERGAELFTPSTSGSITSNSAMYNASTTGGASMASHHSSSASTTNQSSSVVQGDRPISVVLNVTGVSDAQSFQRSRSEIQRSLIAGLQAAQRSA